MQEKPNPSEGWLVERLIAALRDSGWSIERESSGGERGPDLVISSNGYRYVIEVKEVREKPRREHMQAFMADAILGAQARARFRDADPMAIVGAPWLSDRMLRGLREYVQGVAADVAWGVLDERGRIELHGPGLEKVHRPPGRVVGSRKGVRIQNPFSDLGQWGLKVLLAPHVPPKYLSAPRDVLRGVSDLARAAEVSEASASRLLSALQALGYLHIDENGLRLVRVAQLLEQWKASNQGQPDEHPVRFSLPAKDGAARLQAAMRKQRPSSQSPRACLGLFSACRELGLGWVRGAPRHLIVEDDSPSVLAAEFGLHGVEHHSLADVIVRRPRHPKSVFRGCVDVKGVKVADALQCWLDVSAHPARGAEQSKEIMERIGLGDLHE